MRCIILFGILAGAVVVWGATNSQNPYSAYIFPAGGGQGTTFLATVGGQRLRGVNAVYVTGDGVRVKVVQYVGPMGLLNAAQQEELKRRLKVIREQRTNKGGKPQQEQPQEGKQPADKPQPEVKLPDLPELRNLEQKSAQELRELANKFLNPNKRPKPPMAEEVTLEITMDPAAEPGFRELRLRTPVGLSNPLVFQVGNVPEHCEQEREKPAYTPPTAELPVVLNGQIMPGDVDRFPVQLHQGQQIVCAAQARKLIPYLADAVPGWFQAVVALYDAEGKEVAFADDCGFDPDPVLRYQAPKDGVYQVEIRDAIYRGRQDFVYRLVVGEPAQLQAMLPGSRGGVALAGSSLQFDDAMIGDALPRRDEREPNDTGRSALAATMPLVVHGGIDRPGDIDLIKFTGRAGDEIVAEVYARRCGSPLDALLRLGDTKGNVVAWNDDCEDPASGLLTHHADAYLTAKLPANGTYYLQVSDAQRHGGEAYRYAVRIGPRQADFALRMAPSSINLVAGRSAEITVYALRKDGWDGDVELHLQDTPAGFTLNGGRIPAGRDRVRLTITAPSKPTLQPITLRLEGRGQCNGKTVVRPVIPAEEMMQAFAYFHLTPVQQLAVTVTRSGRFAPSVALEVSEPLRIPANGRAEIKCKIDPMPDVPLQFTLSDPPAGITLHEVKPQADGFILVLGVGEQQAGFTDNLIIEASTEIEFKRNKDDAPRKRRVPLGILPALPFTIVQP
jgi:hypothetical protein